jgi:hypothetical protein
MQINFTQPNIERIPVRQTNKVCECCGRGNQILFESNVTGRTICVSCVADILLKFFVDKEIKKKNKIKEDK